MTDMDVLSNLPEGKIQFKVNYSDEILSDIPKARATRSCDQDATDTVHRLHRNLN